MSLETVFDQIVVLNKAILRAAREAGETKGRGEVYHWNNWPAKLQALPSVVLTVTGGNLPTHTGWQGPIQHEVSMIYYFPGVTIAEAQAQAVPIIERVKDTFAANLKLGNRVANFQPVTAPARWYEGPGVIEYGDTQHIGIVFNYVMKDLNSGSSVATAIGDT